MGARPPLAPEATTRVSPGPYFVGVPVHVEVRISDVEESPTPSVDVEAPDGAKLVLVSTAPRISSSVQIINGQLKRWKDVSYVLRYRLTASREGAIDVGPFHVTQKQTKLVAPARRLNVGNVPATSEQRLTLLFESFGFKHGLPSVADLVFDELLLLGSPFLLFCYRDPSVTIIGID